MKCPKCNYEIDEKTLVCPNCRKLLQLVCPKCNTINKTNICKTCGFTIIAKCRKCGKINPTVKEKCSDCGFSTYENIAVSGAKINSFASILISFPNLSSIKKALNSDKLFSKFKSELHLLISNFAYSNNLHREIINSQYVIKFNKDKTFEESAKHAVEASIEVLNSISKINSKLFLKKEMLLQCSISIIKSDVKSLPDDYKSPFNVKIVHIEKNLQKLLSCLQVIADEEIADVIKKDYKLTELNSVHINQQTVRFYELNVKKYVNLSIEEDVTDNLVNLPDLAELDADFLKDNKIFDIDAINFEEFRVSFLQTDSINLINQILLSLRDKDLNLISVRTPYELAPRIEDLLNGVKKLNKFKNIFKITCCEAMKYEPYGFFRELISNICNFSKSPKNFDLHNFEMFKDIDSANYIFNLINLKQRQNSDFDSPKEALTDIFFNIFSSIKESLIVIENFEKIDDSSFDILQMMFKQFDDLRINYVTLASEDFYLHRSASFLLSNQAYSEIVVRPTKFENILSKNKNKFSDIVESYYFDKISQNFNGNYLYLDYALEYLIDNNLIAFDSDTKKLKLSEPIKTVFIPLTLDDFVGKQLAFLEKDFAAYKLLAALLFIGPRIDFGTLVLLNISTDNKSLKKLVEKKIVYLSENAVYINNFNLYLRNLLKTLKPENKKAIAQILLEKLCDNNNISSLTVSLLHILKIESEEIVAWRALAEVNKSLADFNSYVNCSNKVFEIASSNAELQDENYKKEFYGSISELVQSSSPEKIEGLLKDILLNLEDSEDSQKTINIYNKMLQGYLQNGNYPQAFSAICKLFAKLSELLSTNPNDNLYVTFFFMSLIKIEILFNIGNFKECIEVGNEILGFINPETIVRLKPEYLSQEKYEQTIFDALSFVILSKIILLHQDIGQFFNLIQYKLGKLPDYFELLSLLYDTVYGLEVAEIPEISNSKDRFSKILTHILLAFNFKRDDYEAFAGELHKAKIKAKSCGLFAIELICDLLIGYSYFKLNKNKKALKIYGNVLETAEKSGLKLVEISALYLLALLKFSEGSLDYAMQLANNAIVKLEQDENSSEFLFMLFKYLLAQIFSEQNNTEAAKICLNDIQFLKSKNNFNFA